MATLLDSKQIVSLEELLMSQVVGAEALTRLVVEKGVITREEFVEMVKVVDGEVKNRKAAWRLMDRKKLVTKSIEIQTIVEQHRE